MRQLLLSWTWMLIWLLASPWLGEAVRAQVSAPKYANEFLAIGVGARALAMGNAQVAHVADVTAAYWNPAGLLHPLPRYEVALMHNELLAGGAQYDYAGFATPLDSLSHLAISAVRFGTDNIANTLNLFDANGSIDYNRITFFSVADYAFLATYARRVPWLRGMRLGGSLKVIHRSVGSFATGWGFGFDLGAQLTRGPWQLGLAARDVTGTFTVFSINTDQLATVYQQTGNELVQTSTEVALPRLVGGVARQFSFGKRVGLLAALDLDCTFDGRRNVPIRTRLVSVDPRLGLELHYNQLIFLRAGLCNVQQIKNFDGSRSTITQPNFGLGLKISKFTIDYALTNVTGRTDGTYANVFSVKVGF